MPTYLELAQEPVWLAQTTPDVMTSALLDPLRAFYGMGPASIGAAGDNNHLYGRHRSRNWDLTSVYCTDRSYGTQDARDRAGDGDWYRACDVGIQGQVLQDASRRMDVLARSGACPGLAEWFGTFDGVNVSGWYEGHESSSDDSHLYHLHVGVWTEFANDAATMQQLYATITGQAPQPEEPEMAYVIFKDTTGKWWASNGWDREALNDPQGDRAYVLRHWYGATDNQDGPIANPDAFGPVRGTGTGGVSHDELVQAAFEGAQRAERE